MIPKTETTHLIYALALLVGALLSGCFGRTPAPRYYRLQALESSTRETNFPRKVGIAIGPVSVPEALDRPQIAVRDLSSGITFSEYDRWAGPLPKEIASVLADNIGVLLGSDMIIPYTQEAVFQPGYRIVISINHLEGRMGQEVLLEAVWSIRKAEQHKPLTVRKSSFRELLKANSHDEIVKAHDRAIAAFSKEMAQAIMETIGTLPVE